MTDPILSIGSAVRDRVAMRRYIEHHMKLLTERLRKAIPDWPRDVIVFNLAQLEGWETAKGCYIKFYPTRGCSREVGITRSPGGGEPPVDELYEILRTLFPGTSLGDFAQKPGKNSEKKGRLSIWRRHRARGH